LRAAARWYRPVPVFAMASGNGVAIYRFIINAVRSNAGSTRALVVWVTLVDEI
jgi:hypothetical protein